MSRPTAAGSRGRSATTVRAATAALLLTLGVAGPAWAHASLLGTDPADGAVLPTAPDVITLTFDEPVRVEDGGVRLLDAAGTELPSTARAVDEQVLVTPSAPLGQGTVIVSWRVTSADSHPIAGGFTFAVGGRSPTTLAVPTPEQDAAVQVASAAVQGLAYLGVLGACGLIAFDVLVLRGAADASARDRIRRAGVALAVAGGAATVLLLPLTELRQRYAPLSGLADATAWGAQLAQDPGLTLALVGAGLVVAIEAAWAVERRTSSSAGAALAGCGLALGGFAVVGHTRAFGPAAVTLTADLLHLTVAAFWLGGLLGLGLLLRGVRAPAGGSGRASGARPVVRARVDLAAAALARFSTVAAGLVAVLAVTGGLLAWRVLGSWGAVVGTGYGRVLLVKVGVVVVVLGVAAVNRFRIVPRIGAVPSDATAWHLLRGTVAAEAALLAVVVAVTGWLVGADPRPSPTPPAAVAEEGSTGGAADPAGSPGSGDVTRPDGVERTVPLGTGSVTARLTPARTGTNALELTLADSAGRPLEPIADPEVTVTMPAYGLGPLSRPVTQIGPGAYQAVLDLPLPGRWVVSVAVRTSQFEKPVATVPVDLP